MKLEEIQKMVAMEEKLQGTEEQDMYGIVSVKDVYEEEKKNQLPVLFKTGVPTIDCISEGFKEGQLVVITGMPKRGKTTFAKTITKSIYKSQKILWFSFEESIYEFYKDIDPADFWVPKKLKYKDMSWLEERIVASKIQHGTKVVFIDHLHYLFTSKGDSAQTSLQVGELMRDLKRIAVENKLVVFILAHTKKIEGNRIPRAEDVRDSALIANECDKMFVVHRDRTEGNLGMTSMSPFTKIVIELDRQQGANMGMIFELEFNGNILIPKQDENFSHSTPVQATARVDKPARGLW